MAGSEVENINHIHTSWIDHMRYKDNDHGLLRTWRGVELKISITFTHHGLYVRYTDNEHGLLHTWRGAELKISITFRELERTSIPSILKLRPLVAAGLNSRFPFV